MTSHTTPTSTTPAGDTLLTPGEVATLLHVNPKTAARWAAAGKITAVRTLGGHRRYRESEIQAVLSGQRLTPTAVLVSEPAPA